jgi:hypothetical protein
MANSKLFTLGTTEIVDLETGESVPVEGGGFKLLPGPEGTCEWCHIEHPSNAPHNKDSLPYQMKFKQIHGRYPTWTDAMAHCEETVKRFWRENLVELMKANGVEIPADLK